MSSCSDSRPRSARDGKDAYFSGAGLKQRLCCLFQGTSRCHDIIDEPEAQTCHGRAGAKYAAHIAGPLLRIEGCLRRAVALAKKKVSPQRYARGRMERAGEFVCLVETPPEQMGRMLRHPQEDVWSR